MEDAKKAFDTISRKKSIKQWGRILGEKSEAFQRLKKRHKKIVAVTQIGKEQLRMEVPEGVAQGDPNGPPLYSLGFTGAIEEIEVRQELEEVKPIVGKLVESKGIFEEETESKLSTTLYVDDLIDIRTYDGKMEVEAVRTWIRKWIASIIEIQEEWGIEVNEDKSVILLELRGKNAIKVRKQMGGSIEEVGKNGQKFRIVLQAKYLGTIIGDTGDGVNEEIEQRIKKANTAMAALKDIWKQQKLPLGEKIKLYQALIRTIMCYALEVREMTKAQIMRLETAQIKHLRRIIKSPAHITHQSNEEVRKLTGMPSIHSYLVAGRLRFWRKQTLEKNRAVWVANWGHIEGGKKQGNNKDEEDRMGNDIEKLIEANPETGLGEKIKRDKKGKIIIDVELWTTLSGVTKAQIRKVQVPESAAEPDKIKKAGPEEERTMECETCKKKFPNKATLAHHKWAAHGKTIGVRQLVLEIPGSKEFKCFVCKGVFKQKRSAQNHVQLTCTRGKTEHEIAELIKSMQFQQAFGS